MSEVDNDADKRPRVYMRAASKDGEVEVTVQGSEGETTRDVKDVATNRFDRLVDRHGELNGETPDCKEVQ